MHDYAVYFITLALGVAVFYAFNTDLGPGHLLQGDVGEMLKAVGDILQGVTFSWRWSWASPWCTPTTSSSAAARRRAGAAHWQS